MNFVPARVPSRPSISCHEMRLAVILILSAARQHRRLPRELFPSFRQNCATCHGAALKMSNLDLRTRESILSGGDHGPAIEPGNPDKSRCIDLLPAWKIQACLRARNCRTSKWPRFAHGFRKALRWPRLPCAPAPEEANAALAKMEERPISGRGAQLLGISLLPFALLFRATALATRSMLSSRCARTQRLAGLAARRSPNFDSARLS